MNQSPSPNHSAHEQNISSTLFMTDLKTIPKLNETNWETMSKSTRLPLIFISDIDCNKRRIDYKDFFKITWLINVEKS